MVLALAILSFILTVLFSGLNVLLPKNPTLMVATICVGLAGLVLPGIAVGLELFQNSMSGRAIELEVEEFPELLDADPIAHANDR